MKKVLSRDLCLRAARSEQILLKTAYGRAFLTEYKVMFFEITSTRKDTGHKSEKNDINRVSSYFAYLTGANTVHHKIQDYTPYSWSILVLMTSAPRKRRLRIMDIVRFSPSSLPFTNYLEIKHGDVFFFNMYLFIISSSLSRFTSL